MHSPQLLELTAADELVAIENVEVLRQNGFELDVDEDAHPGQRVRLTAQPISKSTVFDTKGEHNPSTPVFPCALTSALAQTWKSCCI